jgi:type IV pilus assembly protein PilX
MLSQSSSRLSMRAPLRAAQKGVVLLIALIVLVVMTMAGLSLLRSVDVATLITGNMAFQQAAIQYGDVGTETAVGWLETNAGTNLHNNVAGSGYAASRQDPVAGQTWDAFWTAVLSAQKYQVPPLAGDTTGNVVEYAIQRLCATAGDPTAVGTNCSVPQTTSSSSASSKGAGVVALQYNGQIYYRITSRITGPRNTISYVQVIVAL